MGIVCKALDTYLDRVVALKLLPAHKVADLLGAPFAVQHFHRAGLSLMHVVSSLGRSGTLKLSCRVAFGVTSPFGYLIYWQVPEFYYVT